MDEHLVGYLLETLDPVTHKRVEQHLRHHPEARAKLALLRQALAPLAEDADDPEPPPGLALAALARVAEHHCALPNAPVASPHQLVGPGRWFRRIDWLVAAVLLLLVGGLALPAVWGQWRQAQRVSCANNLRQFGLSLHNYADLNGGDFPRVEGQGPRGVAGIFVPMLNERGLAQDVSIGCPAQGGKRPPLNYTVAELEALAREAPERFEVVASQLAGHYAYCLGYEQNGRLCGLKRASGDQLPILADCASDSEKSANHGSGQNVLFVGGNVRWCTQPTVGVEGDHIYLNQNYLPQAGVRKSDTVLGASAARPFVGE